MNQFKVNYTSNACHMLQCLHKQGISPSSIFKPGDIDFWEESIITSYGPPYRAVVLDECFSQLPFKIFGPLLGEEDSLRIVQSRTLIRSQVLCNFENGVAFFKSLKGEALKEMSRYRMNDTVLDLMDIASYSNFNDEQSQTYLNIFAQIANKSPQGLLESFFSSQLDQTKSRFIVKVYSAGKTFFDPLWETIKNSPLSLLGSSREQQLSDIQFLFQEVCRSAIRHGDVDGFFKIVDFTDGADHLLNNHLWEAHLMEALGGVEKADEKVAELLKQARKRFSFLDGFIESVNNNQPIKFPKEDNFFYSSIRRLSRSASAQEMLLLKESVDEYQKGENCLSFKKLKLLDDFFKFCNCVKNIRELFEAEELKVEVISPQGQSAFARFLFEKIKGRVDEKTTREEFEQMLTWIEAQQLKKIAGPEQPVRKKKLSI